MNAQLLEYARIELSFALADLSGGTKGQLQAFAENPPADKNCYPRQHIHKVQLGEGDSVREVSAERAPTYALETRSRRKSAPPMKEEEFATCAWRRAVPKLNIYEQAWVKYCYGYQVNYSYQILICNIIWSMFLKKTPNVKLQSRVKKRLIFLLWLAIQDETISKRTKGKGKYKVSELSYLLKIQRQTWSKIYAPYWAEFKGLINVLDSTALKQLLKFVA